MVHADDYPVNPAPEPLTAGEVTEVSSEEVNVVLFTFEISTI